MAKFELKLPKMGSVAEATLNSWLKDIGDHIDIDEAVVKISTDKVDDVPSEVRGTLIEKKFEVDQVVEVGQTIAIIETEGDVQTPPIAPSPKKKVNSPQRPQQNPQQIKLLPMCKTQLSLQRFNSTHKYQRHKILFTFGKKYC